MKYVILRDDDTNAFTPIDCLEQLYRPFLERKMPINLAVIPNVNTHARLLNGQLENFLPPNIKTNSERMEIGANHALVEYIIQNPGYYVAQHGYEHTWHEFDISDKQELIFRMDEGKHILIDAGFPPPKTFVAGHDKISRTAFKILATRYRIISTNFFEKKNLPYSWWLQDEIRKRLHRRHWKIKGTFLLSHPSAYLSSFRSLDTIWKEMLNEIENNNLTILLTHWWEYFREGQDNPSLLKILHQTADYLASRSDIKVLSFDDILDPTISEQILR